MEDSMERIKHDGAAEPMPIIAVVMSKKPPARSRRAATPPPNISKMHAARVRITKIGPSADDPQGWYVEAEILVSDLGIMTLGLPLSQEVFKRELCAIDLDGRMTVKSCEVLE
jgi:hypothetical protein